MAASITKKTSLTAKGVLVIDNDENIIGVQHAETGELFELKELLSDFAAKSVKLSVNYDEDYE